MPITQELDEAFAASLEEWMPRSATWLVAVSGGLDSMVLLHFLRAAGYENLVVAHVNHGLRGEESNEDARFVAGAAAALGYECEQAEVDVAGIAKQEKCSIELAARNLRYEALAKMAESHSESRVVTAHHADDQIETVVINFFRGSGTRGLAGMERVSKREVSGLEIYRPFLLIRRAELERYASEREVAFREDSTNREDFALRNRVRHRLLPEVEAVFQREVSDAILRTAELARGDEAWIAEELGELPRKENGLEVAALRAMSEGKRGRLILRWLRESGVPNCGFEEVARVVELVLSDGSPAKVNLPRGTHARRRAGVLFLEI